jgi:3-phosphoshikimate 1-carboxyvinyltransferase
MMETASNMTGAASARAFLDLAPVAHAWKASWRCPVEEHLQPDLAAGSAGERHAVCSLLDADDVDRCTMRCDLGVRIDRTDVPRDFVVHGQGRLCAEARALFSSAMRGRRLRPLTAVLALAGAAMNSPACRECTSGRSAIWSDALRALHADIRYLGTEGFPPLAIGLAAGRADAPSVVTVRGDVSSQFLSPC